jgi:hypothetical protein
VTSAEALAQVRQRYGNGLTGTEAKLLALAWLDGAPLRAGSNVVDATRLVRARRLTERGVGARDALAVARLSEGLHEATLDDARRIEGLRRVYVDPYVVPANGDENGNNREEEE